MINRYNCTHIRRQWWAGGDGSGEWWAGEGQGVVGWVRGRGYGRRGEGSGECWAGGGVGGVVGWGRGCCGWHDLGAATEQVAMVRASVARGR